MNKRHIIVAHGIYGHGEKGPDTVIPALEEMGYVVHNYDYRWTSATTAGIRALVVRKANDLCLFAERLLHDTGLRPDFLGHSFGVQLGLRSTWHATGDRLYRNAYLFHGAARRGYNWPVGPGQQIEEAHLFNYEYDRALKLTLPLRCVMPWNQMGQLGRLGYTGPVNHNVVQHWLPFKADEVENTHGAWFHEGWPVAARIIAHGVNR